MPKECNFPYPTFFESIRYITRALDLKQSNKALDDLAYERIFDPRKLDDAIQKYIHQPIKKYLCPKSSEFITNGLTESLERYARLIASHSADGVSRPEMIQLLQKYFINSQISGIIIGIHDHFGGPHPATLFSRDALSVATVLSWVEKNETGWPQYISGLEKEQKDRISSWVRGQDLPSCQSIQLLQNSYKTPSSEPINWKRVKTLLFIARSIDFIRRDPLLNDLINEVRLFLRNAKYSTNLQDEIYKLQRTSQENITEIIPSIGLLQKELQRTTKKDNPDELLRHINSIRKGLSAKKEKGTTGYFVDWQEARWNVFSGDLERANKLYKLAFEDALFRAGTQQETIIDEATVVAASLKKPDKVFLKHLKWSLVNFHYDIPSVNTPSPSNKFSDSVENWEIDFWKSNLLTIFPKIGWFPGVNFDALDSIKGPLIIADNKKIKPDFRHLNRKIKVGETRKKTMPQLVHFLMIEDFDITRELIDKGASVNVASDAGDTPILMALDIMNVTDVPHKSLDERFFWLISEQNHTPETINGRTQKKRLLPIISAVETGRLDVVSKILALGANPNNRGLTNEQTALNHCIQRMAMLKNPEEYWENMNAMSTAPESLDSMRRHTAGRTGFTLDHQMQFQLNAKKDPCFNEVISQYKKAWLERITSKMNIESMRGVAKLLIEAGADVNAEHKSPINGYTPLMLAAELDEPELFNLMLIKGGNPEKYYVNPGTNKKINCWHISKHFGSMRIQNILRDIQPFFPSCSLPVIKTD